MACEIYIPDSKQLFLALNGKKEEIENEVGNELEWEELPEKKASRIKVGHKGDLFSQGDWGQYHSWMLGMVLNFQEVFSRKIKQCADGL